MKFHSPPYLGQGTPIPASMGCGEWILEPLVFLSISGQEPDMTDGAVGLGGFVPTGLGHNAIDFESAQISKLLGISVDDLLAGNRAGRLRIENEPAEARHGAESAMKFRFYLDGCSAELTMGKVRAGSA